MAFHRLSENLNAITVLRVQPHVFCAGVEQFRTPEKSLGDGKKQLELIDHDFHVSREFLGIRGNVKYIARHERLEIAGQPVVGIVHNSSRRLNEFAIDVADVFARGDDQIGTGELCGFGCVRHQTRHRLAARR